MKGIQGLIIAVFLGLIGAGVNLAYLYKGRNMQDEKFVGIKQGVKLKRGETILQEHLEEVSIPEANVGSLQDYAYLYSRVNTVAGQKSSRSYSGETGEVLTILPLIKRLGVPLIGMTGNAQSTLARRADMHLDVAVEIEACPLELAPTSSTTAALVMGDALAIALLEARHFTAEDFARSHPGGALGRRLLLTVGDLMHTGEQLPLVAEDAPLREALLEMSAKGLGMTGVVDADGRLAGVFTDGDLRRTLDQDIDIKRAGIADHMTRLPKTVTADMLAAEAVRLLQTHRIGGGALLVVDADNRPEGALNMQDLLRAGVI